MKNEEEFIKNRASDRKRRTRTRRVKVVVILVIIITVTSLVFYTLDNPAFLVSLKNRVTSIYAPDSETAITEGSADISGNGAEEETYQVVEEQPEAPVQEGDQNQSTDDAGAEAGAIAGLWQKIMDFFNKRLAVDEEKFPAYLEIKLYFASLGEEAKFVYEERTINAGNPKIAVENVMRELLDGPEKSFHYPVIPPGTKLLDVEIYENIAKINLSQEFIENSLDSGILDEHVIYTIVNTVTQIPEIDGVVFFIDDIRIKTYGNVDLSIPAIMDEKYLEEEVE